MATKKQETKEQELEEIVSKSEMFIEQNSKKILIGIVAIIVIVAAYFGYEHAYRIPLEKKANAALFKGEQYFAKDSFALALNGNGADYQGLESVISEFGSTNAGNLAKAYAGICYFKLGENEKALNKLKSFDSKDNMVSPAIVGLIGDCYVNMGQIEEGITYFKKAANVANNEVISPVYLKKAGIAYENLKKYPEALQVYQEIKDKYFNSFEASDIDKYIYRAQELNK